MTMVSILKIKKALAIFYRKCFFLVETAGFEPATSCMSSMHSNQLSYASKTTVVTLVDSQR